MSTVGVFLNTMASLNRMVGRRHTDYELFNLACVLTEAPTGWVFDILSKPKVII